MSEKNPAAVALGKLSGAVRSPAKAAASRENGKKGGGRLHAKHKAKQPPEPPQTELTESEPPVRPDGQPWPA